MMLKLWCFKTLIMGFNDIFGDWKNGRKKKRNSLILSVEEYVWLWTLLMAITCWLPVPHFSDYLYQMQMQCSGECVNGSIPLWRNFACTQNPLILTPSQTIILFTPFQCLHPFQMMGPTPSSHELLHLSSNEKK